MRHLESVNAVIDDITMQQYKAIMQCEYECYINEDYDITVNFNRKGNVFQADTLHVGNTDVIVSLGTGRVYVAD